MPNPEGQPADHVGDHPLMEKLVHPLDLTDVKFVIEGLTPDGDVVRLRSAGTIEILKREHLALVTVQPLDELDSRWRLTQPEETHVVLVGKALPDANGALYHVEALKEREL